MITLAAIAAALALFPALLFWRNTAHFKPPPEPQGDFGPVSVLIPARNEEASIGPAVESVLASENVELEVVVLDDQSTDRTAEVVREIAARDDRARLEAAPPLPEGWCGKQHACYSLSRLAKYDTLMFLDADVRLTPGAVRRMAGFLQASNCGLVSGFPRQETGTLIEKLVIPLIHFLLLGFLPIARMRQSKLPSLSAGCGQLFVTSRAAYDRVGGHGAVRSSLHDGVTLPRAYRAAGVMTDLCDATPLAACRMYRSAGELWHGLAKNAREGLGAPALLPFSTALLAGGQVLPWALLIAAVFAPTATPVVILAAVAAAASLSHRVGSAVLYRQSVIGALLHPAGVLLLLAIQWYANFRAWVGKPVGWKGRPHPAAAQT